MSSPGSNKVPEAPSTEAPYSGGGTISQLPPLSIKWWDRLYLAWQFAILPMNLGLKGEWVARRFLKSQGMRVIEHSHRNRYGEIDLIAVDQRTIVFVEVKTRTTHVAGSGAEAVDEAKQQHIALAATEFLRSKRLLDQSVRFDVVSLTWPDEAGWPEIEYYRDAFESPGKFQLYH